MIWKKYSLEIEDLVWFNMMNIPFVKEWGSWIVFLSSSIIGMLIGFKSSLLFINFENIFLLLLGMAIIINAKAPISSLIKTRDIYNSNLIWTFIFILTGSLIIFFLMFETRSIMQLSFIVILIVIYFLLIIITREHFILSELIAFSIITSSSYVMYYYITGDSGFKLYIGVLLFFAASVFKVRMRLKMDVFHRVLMILYCVLCVFIYSLLSISLIPLIPLLENISLSIHPQKYSLKYTGYMELIKSIVFMVIFTLLYPAWFLFSII